MKPITLALVLLLPIVAAAQTPSLICYIASGSQFTLVVKTDGTVVGWGRDPDGQASRPVSANRLIPAPLAIELPVKVLQVAMGDTTQYALPKTAPWSRGVLMTRDSWVTGRWGRPESWAGIRAVAHARAGDRAHQHHPDRSWRETRVDAAQGRQGVGVGHAGWRDWRWAAEDAAARDAIGPMQVRACRASRKSRRRADTTWRFDRTARWWRGDGTTTGNSATAHAITAGCPRK